MTGPTGRWRQRPLGLAAAAWGVLVLAAAATLTLLPQAHVLYRGHMPLAGLVLHRGLIGLFLAAALMAAAALLLILHAEIVRADASRATRAGRLLAGLLVSVPAILLAGVATFLLLFGDYLGMTLG